MPIEVYWYLPHKVLLVVDKEPMVTEELIMSSDLAIELLDTSSATFVSAIVDTSEIKSLPKIKDLPSLKYLKHPKLYWAVVFGSSPLIQVMSNIINLPFQARVRFVKNLENSIAFLKEADPELSDLPIIHDYSTLSLIQRFDAGQKVLKRDD